MSIPLDRLYHYIENMIEDIYGDSVIIYRFFPHGSKKFTDLTYLNNYNLSWKQKKIRPQIYCNDQEPLNFDLYENITESQLTNGVVLEKLKQFGLTLPIKNFRTDAFTIWDHALLIHSEQRSNNVEKYRCSEFLPVYYWSHAVIARDWFRFSEHMTQLKETTNKFLIYARGWTGTREYRLKFLELLIESGLQTQCKTNIQPVDAETLQHYKDHDFLNPGWAPGLTLEDYFDTKDICSTFSADFDLADYNSTDIEIVLETLFDDERLHFTEKILRPIALGQPFILAGSHGGLEYLRHYGFRTFDNIWCENYDVIQDPRQRMQAIVETMKSILAWTDSQRVERLQQANEIAAYNKQRFFSKEFFEQVTKELQCNLTQALADMQNKNTGSVWHQIRQDFPSNHPVQAELSKLRSQQDTDEVYDIVLKYRQRNLAQISNQQP
jgi:hypothetical protein